MKVRSLRLMLPVLHALDRAARVPFAYRQADEPWVDGGTAPLAEIAAGWRADGVELFLHPQDCAMADIPLPPLPPAKCRQAVQGEVESLALVAVEQLAIGHGPCCAAGTIPVAWTAQAPLRQALAMLTDMGFSVKGVFPAPFCLPVADDGGWSAAIVDGWGLVRTGVDTAMVLPVSFSAQEMSGAASHGDEMRCGDDPQYDDGLRHFQQLLADGGHIVQWAGARSSRQWSGPVPSWRMPDVAQRTAGAHRGLGWGLAACGLGLLAWVGGLNLYAGSLADQGMRIQQDMRARVRAAFPELPVIVNPLQQARQQRDARLSGAGGDGQPDPWTMLARASASLLQALDGQVAEITYGKGALTVTLRGGRQVDAARMAALMQQAGEAGVQLESLPDGWRLRVGMPTQGAGVPVSGAAGRAGSAG